MKIKKHVRRGSLAALIALALTSSALAMPTGGEVVRGAGDITVNGGTDFSTIANNATITANNDGQINWQAFNIANGETLNFNIANGKTLVNQVTSAQLSDILGTMNQTSGTGNVVLVNPNGIHIGATAVLNVPDLTLSALSIDQATDTTRVLKAGGGTGALAGQIVVDADAANHASFTANELNLIGQKVTVADGVVFDMGGTADKAMLQVYATDNAAWTFDGSHVKTQNLTHNAGNDVSFGGTVNMNAANNSKDVEIGGATTQVKNAVFHGDKLETTAYAASKLSIDKRDADPNKHSIVAEATAANTLTADHIQATGDSLSLGGGAVALKNSTINVDDVSLDGVAKSATKGDGVRTETLTAPDRTVSIESTNLRANEVGVYGGKVDVANDVSFAPLASGQRDFTVVAGNVDHEKSLYTTTTGNALAFHGKIDGFGRSDTHPIVLLGNTVNVDGANLGSVNAVGSLKIGAVNEVNAKNLATLAATATAANALSANGLTVKSPATTQFLGGTMTFTNANMDVAGEISVTTGALRELGNEARTITTAPDQKVTFAGTGTFKARSVDVRGGSVAVDSGITFEAKDPTHETGLDIVAGSESDDGHGAITYTMTRGNDLVFKGKSVNFGATTEEEPVALLGATVNLDGARIENASHVNTAAAQRIVSKNNGDKSVTAGTGNALSGDGLTINQGDVNVVGGNVALKNGSIHTGGDLTVMAVKTATLGSEKTAAASKNNVVHLDGVDVNAANARTISGKVNLVNNARVHANDVAFRVGQKFAEDHVDATKDNTLSMWNSHVSGADVTLAGGGAETYQGSTVAASNALKQGDVTHTDGAALSLVKDAVSSVQENGTDADGFTVKAAADVPPVPEKPVVPPAPSADETSLSAQDEENIDTGRLAAQDALAATSKEEAVASLVKTIAKLNEKVAESPRQTAGIVVGMVKEIAETSTLDAAAKLDLQRAVLDAYAPVQEVKAEQDHHAVRTLADAVRAAENTLVTATTHEHDSSNVQPVTFMD
jgi:putative filamentous hemagglutinin family protein